AWPTDEALEQDSRAPIFLHLVAAYQEPGIATTLRGLLAARYPHAKVCYVVVTKAAEDEAPHPAMGESTGALCRRLIAELPPYEAKRLSHLVMPGPGRKAEQLNWALRPEALAAVLKDHALDPSRVFVAVSDADSVPGPDTYRWIAGEELGGRGALAYQGVTLSLGNWAALDTRGRICAIQQSSIFIRVSIARLINEVRRIRLIGAVLRSLPAALARWVRPALEFCFRRSQICLGHNQFVRLDVLQALGGFPTRGATEDSTLGYMLGARGILIRAMPMIELTDLPETKAKIVRQNARWYKGVLDDVAHLWATWRRAPSAFNLAQLIRHVVNKVVEWPVAAAVYPTMGYLGWHFAYAYRAEHPLLFFVAVAVPTVSLGLTVWVGGIETQRAVRAMEPYLPRRIALGWTTWREWLRHTRLTPQPFCPCSRCGWPGAGCSGARGRDGAREETPQTDGSPRLNAARTARAPARCLPGEIRPRPRPRRPRLLRPKGRRAPPDRGGVARRHGRGRDEGGRDRCRQDPRLPPHWHAGDPREPRSMDRRGPRGVAGGSRRVRDACCSTQLEDHSEFFARSPS
ncbi:MAG: glycosyltransferase family 2 protein, partial [Candidatus Rokubacteria bacterium]|nr:glycosyltransferase family 2 protein [Candidatus Rokubacteria bacterium]